MKLLVLDVEGTLFETSVRLPGAEIDSTIWQALAYRLGQDAVREEIATHGRWSRGEYRTYIEWMRDTIAIHRRYGLTEELFRLAIDSATYNSGVADLLTMLDRTKYEPVLITGGFRELAARVQADFAVVHAFAACEYLFSGGALVSFNLLPCDFEGKMDFIRLMLKEYGLTMDDWVFIGDGMNDVPIAQAAPLSIGYRPHPRLRAVVNHTVEAFSDIARYLG